MATQRQRFLVIGTIVFALLVALFLLQLGITINDGPLEQRDHHQEAGGADPDAGR